MRKLTPVAVVAATAGIAVAAIPAFAATKTVSLKDNSFSPKSLTISSGTKVKWVWKGSNPHNVTVTRGPKKFASPTKTSGSYTKVFHTKGTYTIVCTIHQGMTSKIRVK
jgi:plastocyanin